MQLNVPSDLEALINKRLSTGEYTSAEDVLRHALEAQDAEESLVRAQIEEGYLQAESGDLLDGRQARSEIEALKASWRQSRAAQR